MNDYLLQAPVLAPGTVNHKSTQRNRILHIMCARGEKLRVVLTAFGIAPVLRQASGKGFKRGYKFLPLLRHANSSSLAQQIQRRPDPADQRLFWDQLSSWNEMVRFESAWCPTVLWMAENLPPGDHDMGHYADMFRHTGWTLNFLRTWTWREFIPALHRWEDSFAKAYKGPDPNTPLSPHAVPERATVGGFEFVHLNTRRALAEEGSMMRHCVGGYASGVTNGLSCVYSLQSEGRRRATLQVGRKISSAGKDLIWTVQQLKGRCNSRPPAGTAAAAEEFCAELSA